ncbi:hypothetical protein IWY39_002580 [Sphingobium sp. JAI105]|uniref:hypothetical protein n=1 Tax=Sphingobium sp. JAI105 TaxID=2787715 RepID=UPI0018C9FFDD|nr:hypothetical protein [Sphingobium sp. JAI105]MBG6118776.1 hypothetical protein [Sphingobium sp. JAI105]
MKQLNQSRLVRWRKDHGIAFTTEFESRGILWCCWITAVQKGSLLGQGTSVQIHGKQAAFEVALDELVATLRRKGYALRGNKE